MNHKEESDISRRRFIATATLSSAAAMLAPHQLFAQYGNTVNVMRKEAATAKIVVKPIRNNISVLMGSGGNIAVLPGKDGKLLIDSGFAVSRTGITNALAGINSDPIKHLINTHWHVDHTDGNEWLHAAGAKSSPREKHSNIYRLRSAFLFGRLPFHLPLLARVPPSSSMRSEQCNSME